MTRQIIALGGGGFTGEESPALDLYILRAAQNPQPRVCLLPTASGDNAGLITYFHRLFTLMGSETRHLALVSPEVVDMEGFLLDQDIIYVSGGNTKSMLALWREWGVDKILRKAYERGVILAGVSAGFVCWFETCLTDSMPGAFSTMGCLGLLPGSACAHFSQQARKEIYSKRVKNNSISPGFGAPDNVGLHFIDEQLHHVVSSEPGKFAHRVSWDETESLPAFFLEET